MSETQRGRKPCVLSVCVCVGCSLCRVNDDMYLSANTRLGLEPFNFAFDAVRRKMCSW